MVTTKATIQVDVKIETHPDCYTVTIGDEFYDGIAIPLEIGSEDEVANLVATKITENGAVELDLLFPEWLD